MKRYGSYDTKAVQSHLKKLQARDSAKLVYHFLPSFSLVKPKVLIVITAIYVSILYRGLHLFIKKTLVLALNGINIYIFSIPLCNHAVILFRKT